MKYIAPSLEFKKAFDIDLTNTWGLTDHYRWQQVIMGKEFKDRLPITEMWYEQIPHLPKATTTEEKYHAVFGAISQFNYDDINFFIKNTGKNCMEYNKKIYETFPLIKFNWVISPKSVDRLPQWFTNKFKR